MVRSRSITSILVIVFCFGIARAAEVEDISFGWKFAPDPNNVGHEEAWHQPGFDDTHWATMAAGDWEDQGFTHVDGAAWYRRTFRLPAEMEGKRIWLNIAAINDWGEVYCNGQLLGRFGSDEVSFVHTPVTVELTPTLHGTGEQLLVIRVVDAGNRGGIQVPCTLTSDPTQLAVNDLLLLMPGYSGRPTVVGMQLPTGVLTGKAPQVALTLSLNDQPVELPSLHVQGDHQGRAMVVAQADLPLNPGDVLTARAEFLDDPEKSMVGIPLEKRYECPEPQRWSGEYARLRILNNFVTELRSLPVLRTSAVHVPFLVPRDGWVFIGIRRASNPYGELDNSGKAIIWRKNPDSGDMEAMHYLSKGRHVLALKNILRAGLTIRAVPEIAFCYWPTKAVVAALPPRDRAFAEKYIFPHANVLLTHDDMTEEEFAAWIAEGRRWVSNTSLPGLQTRTPPSADDVYAAWEKNACLKRPGYSGIIVDEFLSASPEHYRAWTEATQRIINHPKFKGQTFYAWVVDTFNHPPGLEYMRQLYDWNGKFAWERYLHEQPDETVAWLKIYRDLSRLRDWEKLMPNLRERLLVCLGSFSTPSCSLNINPAVDFLPYMDMQFHFLATDPMFFGTYGIFQWAAHYADDDALRFAQKLYRHYCIEGKTSRFTDRPYALTYISNPDFSDGLAGWTTEPAEPESIVWGTRAGLGKIQGRWAGIGVGDACAVLIRSASGLNKISQTLNGLRPGELYSVKYIVADLDDLSLAEDAGVYATLNSVTVLNDKSFRFVIPSSYALNFEGFNRENRAYTTYCQVVFRAESATAELSFSDWKEGVPAGPVGKRLALNFVEVMPYYGE